MEKQHLYRNLKEYLLKKNIKRAAVFGSFARNEETELSDIDLLLDADGLTMFDILRIEDELQTLCQRTIDVVEYKAVKNTIKKSVFANIVELI